MLSVVSHVDAATLLSVSSCRRRGGTRRRSVGVCENVRCCYRCIPQLCMRHCHVVAHHPLAFSRGFHLRVVWSLHGCGS
jgi:hypothetical protein